MTIYADDLSAGQEFTFGEYTLSEEDIVGYAEQWDPIPLHTDPVAARDGGFGGVIASGLHTMAVYQRLVAQQLWVRLAGGVGRSFEIRFLRPVRPGTTLSGRATVTSVTPRPDRGDAVVVITGELTGDGGKPVLGVVNESVLPLRPEGP